VFLYERVGVCFYMSVWVCSSALENLDLVARTKLAIQHLGGSTKSYNHVVTSAVACAYCGFAASPIGCMHVCVCMCVCVCVCVFCV